MEIKTFEIRDRATFIPVVALRPLARGEAERYLWAREGFVSMDYTGYVLLTRLSNLETNYDPNSWGNRTMDTAHRFIRDNWRSLISGQVLDVEFILGEVDKPKESERLHAR